jgi:hypothetical protein
MKKVFTLDEKERYSLLTEEEKEILEEARKEFEEKCEDCEYRDEFCILKDEKETLEKTIGELRGEVRETLKALSALSPLLKNIEVSLSTL